MLAKPVDHFLIISRPKDADCDVAASIEYEATHLSEANSKCQELIKANPNKTYKIETWTKVR